MQDIIGVMQIVATDGSDLTGINEQLKTLILSVEGTIPGNRDFGLAREFISYPPREAINMFAMELESKVAIFIPEITIARVERQAPETDGDVTPITRGQLDLIIYVERRNEE